MSELEATYVYKVSCICHGGFLLHLLHESLLCVRHYGGGGSTFRSVQWLKDNAVLKMMLDVGQSAG